MTAPLHFLKSYFGKRSSFSNSSSHLDLKILPLKGDGGHRNYSRIKKGEHSFILMSCGERDPSLKLFISIQNRLKAHVLSPQIFHFDLKNGFLLSEDLGEESLESFYLQKGEAQSLCFYKKALKQLIALQSQVSLYQKDPLFDQNFFLQEFEQSFKDMEKYFKTFSKQKSFSFSKSKYPRNFKNLKKEIQNLFSDLKQSDFVFCHRDYHSKNLMIKNRDIYMIDFQDGAKGPWFYDLASLLYDCYIPLTARESLYQFYFDHLPDPLRKQVKSVSHIKKKLEQQFLQRGLKACGRFCAFKLENNKNTHLKYIKSTLILIHKLAKKHSYQNISHYATESLLAFQNTPTQNSLPSYRKGL